MKNKVFYIVLLWLITIQGIVLNPVYGQRNSDNIEPDRANNYEILIENKLGAYIKEHDFIVNVRIRQDTITEFNSVDSKINDYYNALPGIPDASPFFQSISKDTNPQSNIITSRVRYRKYKNIELILSDIYGARDIEFIKDLIRLVVPVNEQKGDRINVISRKFPKGSTDPLTAANDSTNAVNGPPPNNPNPANQPASTGPVYNNTITNTTDKPVRDSTFSSFQQVAPSMFSENYLPAFLLSFILLLIIALLVYLIITQNKKARSDEETQRYLDALPPPGPALPGGAPEMSETPEEQRRRFTSYFIKNPKAISEIIESEVITNGIESLTKYGKSIAAVNHELFLLLEPYLNSRTFLLLESRIKENKASTDPALNEIQLVLQKLKALNENDGQGIFSFLSRINDKQLLFLLRDENTDTIGITLSQLNGERAQKILDYFDENKKSEILTQMGFIGNQSSRFFKEVALRLTEKLPEFEGMKDLSIDGLSGVLNILDNLPESEQNNLLLKIELKAPQLVNEIRKLFIGFSNVIHVEDAILEKALLDVETTPLIEALSGYDKEVQEKIIRIRPSREQIIIRSQLEENNNPIEAGAITRKKIVLSVRNQLKNHERKN